MPDIADRYRGLALTFSNTVADVPPEAWSNPSPCEGWTARDVVAHVVDTELDFLRRQGLPSPEVDTADPVAAWPVVRDAVQAVLDDPALAPQAFDGWFGPTTVEQTIDRFYAMDLVVHRWDLAKAAGLVGHQVLPEAEIDRLRADANGFGEALRMPGVCGPEVEVAPDASAQDRLLGFLGRRP